MGEEADADWQDGLVEWGVENSKKWFRKQKELQSQRRSTTREAEAARRREKQG